MNTDTALEHCRHLIQVALGWGDPSSWTNEDFDDLSERIFQKTSVRLSVSTLKRIWGKVKYDHSPTTATLNTLARYAGFESWRDFLQHNASATHAAGPPPPADKPAPRRPILAPLIIATIALAALLSLLSARLHPTGTALSVRFESRRTSDGLPNSVVFDYDATPLHPHEVMIQQSWDIRRREKVDPNGKQHTSIYYYPGYFAAKLVVDGEIMKESPVFITTKGWKGIVGRPSLPVYLSTKDIAADSGLLGVTTATLSAITGSAVFSDTWVTFADVRAFPDIHGTRFILATTVKNTSTVEQCLCRNIRITLLGTISAIVVPLSDKGCIASLGILTGSSAVNGKDHDLSAFGCDFSSWQRIVCSEEDHVLKIAVNGQPAFSMPNAQSIGDIVGLRIAFEGTGAIREAMLQGSGQPINLLSDTPYR